MAGLGKAKLNQTEQYDYTAREREKSTDKHTYGTMKQKKNCTISSYTMYEERCTMLGCVNMKKEE